MKFGRKAMLTAPDSVCLLFGITLAASILQSIEGQETCEAWTTYSNVIVGGGGCRKYTESLSVADCQNDCVLESSCVGILYQVTDDFQFCKLCVLGDSVNSLFANPGYYVQLINRNCSIIAQPTLPLCWTIYEKQKPSGTCRASTTNVRHSLLDCLNNPDCLGILLLNQLGVPFQWSVCMINEAYFPLASWSTATFFNATNKDCRATDPVTTTEAILETTFAIQTTTEAVAVTTSSLETTTEAVVVTTSEPYPNHTIEDINECASNPCIKPNSFCVDGYNRYFCYCNLGYSGRFCSRVIPAIVIGATCEELYPKLCAAFSIRLGRPIPEENGPYTLISLQLGLFRVFCDFSKVGLQWTVIQRRTGGEVNFYRSWTEYQSGFGHPSGDFWLGADYINKLITHNKRTVLRIELTDWTGSTCYQEYDNFSIADASDKYRIISLGNTLGTCGDSLTSHLGMQFSTYDSDNDLSASNCAQDWHGAFWYKDCGQANLNGRYVYGEGPVGNGQGITWQAWRGSTYSYKSASMKIRKK